MRDDEISRDTWLRFVGAFEALLEVRLRKPGRPHLRAYREFISEACTALRDDAFVAELTAALASEDDAAWVHGASKRLLAMEVAAFGESYVEMTGRDPLDDARSAQVVLPPVKRDWLIRDASAGDMLGAGRTVLGSLRDGLEFLPGWARGIIKAGEEAVSIVV